MKRAIKMGASDLQGVIFLPLLVPGKRIGEVVIQSYGRPHPISPGGRGNDKPPFKVNFMPAPLLLRQERLSLSDLGPISVGFCADRHKLGVVGLGFLPIAGSLGGSSCSVESPVAVRVLL